MRGRRSKYALLLLFIIIPMPASVTITTYDLSPVQVFLRQSLEGQGHSALLGRQPGIEVNAAFLVEELDAESRVGHAVSIVGDPWKLALGRFFPAVHILCGADKKESCIRCLVMLNAYVRDMRSK